MLSVLLLAALQAGSAQTTVLATAADVPAQDQTAESQPAETPRKRVCRNVLDTRTGPVAKSRKVCRLVDANGADAG